MALFAHFSQLKFFSSKKNLKFFFVFDKITGYNSRIDGTQGREGATRQYVMSR
jgi:hypothetical protein